MSEVIRLGMWSGPRNISTAMMRSWENRPDTVVVDEPLYAHYLAASRLDHPMREEVIAAGPTDPAVAVARLLGPVPEGTSVFYQKHMTHHLLPGMETGWIASLRNVLLIRDPRLVVASYVKARASVTPTDIGLPQQAMLYDELTAAGLTPPVIDASDFLRAPEAYLRAICEWLAVAFDGRMLHWPPGPRDSDGVWAPHWYASVRESTGFQPFVARHPELPDRYAAVAEECEPMYRRLYDARLTTD